MKLSNDQCVILCNLQGWEAHKFICKCKHCRNKLPHFKILQMGKDFWVSMKYINTLATVAYRDAAARTGAHCMKKARGQYRIATGVAFTGKKSLQTMARQIQAIARRPAHLTRVTNVAIAKATLLARNLHAAAGATCLEPLCASVSARYCFSQRLVPWVPWGQTFGAFPLGQFLGSLAKIF